ncbi:TonB-dependent receptor [Xanthovirga aplysinae]|uniref:TonB-dependent receptor n=1 Tax=Xanthovirga aplysinae TaxID=2529853 RepID=UPI0012BD5B5D|nr:TonB-dependent receptor [Xanthovirga aplysinae]MTI33576.1 TonB-dependent receptor [Xanthovirga aplysinae]
MKKLFTFLILSLVAFPFLVNAQTVSGVVESNDGPVIGANLIVGPGVGTTTDIDGKYSLTLSEGDYTLTVSYLGYVSQTFDLSLKAGESKTLNVSLVEDNMTLQDVVVVGSRHAGRSSTDTPLPVDVLSAKELGTTGQATFDKALQYRVPSFNTVQTPVNDATSLLDPYEIRNMGPSRTLVLINGKRKNSSSLLYTQTSPGRGESGADISAIPTDAIERVEILRDGASAQYGSDAIAGVMNIILKEDAEQGSVNLRTGITSKGDGEMLGLSLNNGSKLTENGFINYTVDLSKVNLANRPGTVDAEGEASDFGADLAEVERFLAKMPDAGNVNGSPETTAAKFLVNGGVDLNENAELYFNAAYVYKMVNSFANYRTPYWRTTDYGLLTPAGEEYMGYLPTFEGELNDYNATVGFKSKKNGWNTDVSFTTGGNQQAYTVQNTVNHGIEQSGGNSPIIFRPGGSGFSHNVGNIDISRLLSDKVSLAFGSEFRTETYQIFEGDSSSYKLGGADSFGGNSPDNSFKVNRYNFGGYVDFAFDFTKDFMVNATARYENYSDFGDAFVWKLSSRYKFLEDRLTLRASLSTGFRAPSLHQIYTQKAQYSFVPGQGIQVQGLVNNVSPQAKLLGVPKLDAEKSTNFTIGLGAQPTNDFSFTLDYYNIRVNDRIIYSNNIGPTEAGNTTLDQILRDNGIVSLSFFANAVDTRTSGIDFVANYKNVALGQGKLAFNLSGNYTLENKRIGAIRNPKLVEDAEQSVLNAEQEALMFTSRPEFKAILGIDYQLNKFNFALNNTLFGPTKFRNSGLDQNLQVEFLTKVVTDLSINYQATEKLSINFNVNNILNVLPEWKFVALNAEGQSILNNPEQEKIQSNLITFNQRYSQMTYDGYHFSQLGTMFNLGVNMRF